MFKPVFKISVRPDESKPLGASMKIRSGIKAGPRNYVINVLDTGSERD